MQQSNTISTINTILMPKRRFFSNLSETTTLSFSVVYYLLISISDFLIRRWVVLCELVIMNLKRLI